ncbi:MAG TPA: iron-containing alcohol dehydrogenase, partial [Bacillota bacterium]
QRTTFPKAAKEIFFGRGSAAQQLAKAVEKKSSDMLVVVGASSSKTQSIQECLQKIFQAARKVQIFEVQGHADQQTIRGGIEAVHRIDPDHLLVIGGGTTLDVGKAIAGLARQEGGEEITPFQTGERELNPDKVLPWIAVPTTSGTGSESTNNAVVELGEEKRSIRKIPPPAMIIADPCLTDSLPLSSTIISLVDAMAQSLEVITHAAATPAVQTLSLAAFLNLAQGMQALIQDEKNPPGERASSNKDGPSARIPSAPTASKLTISPEIRTTLSWGSLLMGIAFAHAGLGLPHALVHFCMKFGLAHGQMVGMLLVPGLAVQALSDGESALRLARVEQAFINSAEEISLNISFDQETTASADFYFSRLLGWLEGSITKLFTRVGLATSLQKAGLSAADLDWITAQEYALGASFGVPKRRATKDELRTVLQKAWSK